jgi:type I restriction enzyme S subunit
LRLRYSFVVPVPPVAEQVQVREAIRRASSELGALVAEAERAIALLQERRTALISAAVTGQIDVTQWTKASA